MSKLIVLGLLSLIFIVTACGPKIPQLTTNDDKVLYAMGVMQGERLKALNLTEKEMLVFYAGFSTVALKEKPQLIPSEFYAPVNEFYAKRVSASAEVYKIKGAEFLNKFSKAEGVKKTASGLAYKIITAGTGKKPSTEDKVMVHYHGTLIDGVVFDSSVDRGEAVSLAVSRLIKGWAEGIQLIGVGGKIKLVIPSDLAYGDAGSPPTTPGGSTIILEVELKEILKAKK